MRVKRDISPEGVKRVYEGADITLIANEVKAIHKALNESFDPGMYVDLRNEALMDDAKQVVNMTFTLKVDLSKRTVLVTAQATKKVKCDSHVFIGEETLEQLELFANKSKAGDTATEEEPEGGAQ